MATQRTTSAGRTSTSTRSPKSTANPWYELRRSTIQGRGAFAKKLIPEGTQIVEYTGQLIDAKEADRRYDDATMRRHHTFLFALENGKVIDAAVGGSDARFLNHSCAPNCEAIEDEEEGRIFIEALRSIEKDEELVYDYSYARTKDTTPEDEAFYACRCGAPTCRGTILVAEKKKSKPTQAKSKSTANGTSKSKSNGAPPSKSKASPKSKSKSKSKSTRA